MRYRRIAGCIALGMLLSMGALSFAQSMPEGVPYSQLCKEVALSTSPGGWKDAQSVGTDSTLGTAAGAPTSNWRGAWREALSASGECDRYARLSEIGSGWFQEDPESAMHALATQVGLGITRLGAGEILGGWMLMGEEDAFKLALQAMPIPQGRSEIIGIALGTVALRDPDLALQRVTSFTASERRTAIQLLFRYWAHAKPRNAWEYAANVHAEYQPWKQIAQKWVARDPESAFDAVVSRFWNREWEDWIFPLFVNWAEADPKSAATWAVGFDAPRHGRRGELAQVAVAFLSVEQPEEVASLLAGPSAVNGPPISHLSPTFWDQLDSLLGQDPGALRDWHVAQSSGLLRELSVRRVAQTLVRSDQGEAMNWLFVLPQNEAVQALDPVVFHLDQTDSLYAESVVLGINRPDLLERGIKSIVNARACPKEFDPYDEGRPMDEITQDDLEAVRKWVATRVPMELRVRVYPALFLCWSSIDLTGAAHALSGIEVESQRLAATMPVHFLLQSAFREYEKDPSGDPPSIEAMQRVHDGLPEPLKEQDLYGAHILYSHYKEQDSTKAEPYREGAERFVKRSEAQRVEREAMSGELEHAP